MTYRIGHHSTSDDSLRYRPKEEVELMRTQNNPITRLCLYLKNQGWWDKAKDEELHKASRQEVLDAFLLAESKLKPPIKDLFTDVYDELTPALKEQQEELWKHIALYPQEYPIQQHKE
eukprot:TRINITY_DN7826_c0_g1_i3.p1 TRINITY_DN7826_c0_g1~~TRINITY_DN7826_c0_g1_i3.p1  ORF type:complete len:118 (-),score=22.59 TRINITY_DN7826_c0_g1_i3:10-363(-)